MITDGQAHDVPKSAQVLGFDAPVHALLTGTPGEFDRRIEILKAPRYGIVGSTREIELRVVETGRKGRAGDRVLTHPPRGQPGHHALGADRPAGDGTHVVPARRPEHHRGRAGGGARRVDHRQQPHGGRGRGRAREPARAAGLRRAARRRARVAQPPQVRRRRRPRAFHHPAPAAEAGRHAHQPALAHRLPDARAVLGEDQGLRPHHLRPLPAPRHPADALLREHRPLRAGGRRAAGGVGRRLCGQDQPRLHGAQLGAAGHAHRPADRASVQGEALGRRRQASGNARAAGLRGEGPGAGAAGSGRWRWRRGAAACS